ncbi:MAG: DEAD/DEAH box helicase [Magnetococcus sp. WYHC-3]
MSEHPDSPPITGVPDPLSSPLRDGLRRVRPGSQPVAWRDGQPLYNPADIETLHSKKGWKKLGRRVLHESVPVHVDDQEGRLVGLFALSQTVSEDEFLQGRRGEIDGVIAQTRESWGQLLGTLEAWNKALPHTGPDVAQAELEQMLGEHQTLLRGLEGLRRPARLLELPLPDLDAAPLQSALQAMRRRRLEAIIAESCSDYPRLAVQVADELDHEEAQADVPFGLTPYWQWFGRFHKRFEERLRTLAVNEAVGLREFHTLFSARDSQRHFTLYLGPTNSGKTYQALRRLSQAQYGVYLAPLRLLALEVAETLNGWGVPCEMVTGEERLPMPGAHHSARTVEMLPLDLTYDVAVIDEAQMLGDPDRGWAWTQAILGVRAEEVCVLGAPEALPVLEKLLKLTGDPYDVVRLERLSPLEMLPKPVKDFDELEPGTALVTFSRSGVLNLKAEVERQTGRPCAVLYGALPPEVRRRQAHLFASGELPFLVATDAIGMGLNLPIKTILFAQDRKFIDHKEVLLTPMEVRQIAGRAGRFGKNERGYVGTFGIPLQLIRNAFNSAPPSIERAHLAPNLGHILALAELEQRRGVRLADLFNRFRRMVKPDPNIYRLGDLEDQIFLARMTDRHPELDLETRFALAAAPVPLRSNDATQAFAVMCAAVARRRPLTVEDLVPTARGPQAQRLSRLETDMTVINLYAWLHYRFQEVFPDLDTAVRRRVEINTQINRLLAKRDAEVRACSHCDAPLPAGHRFTLCDDCHHRLRSQHRQDRGPRGDGERRRPAAAGAAAPGRAPRRGGRSGRGERGRGRPR